MGAGTRALLGPRAPVSRRRALRGAAQGGADVASRFPLLAPEVRCGALTTRSSSSLGHGLLFSVAIGPHAQAGGYGRKAQGHVRMSVVPTAS